MGSKTGSWYPETCPGIQKPVPGIQKPVLVSRNGPRPSWARAWDTAVVTRKPRRNWSLLSRHRSLVPKTSFGSPVVVAAGAFSPSEQKTLLDLLVSQKMFFGVLGLISVGIKGPWAQYGPIWARAHRARTQGDGDGGGGDGTLPAGPAPSQHAQEPNIP